MQLGVGLRVVAGCLGGSLLVALVAGVLVIPLAKGGGYPEPFALFGGLTRHGPLGIWLWQGGLLVAAALLGGRAIAVGVAGLGWLLLPREHRELLGRVDEGALGPAAPIPPPSVPARPARTVLDHPSVLRDSSQEPVRR